ncbi:hypothetical protein PBRA_002492 [Plasmodiophora brassicae]|uniref:J domain-containing protein n=1 Tax=Plasmodiophora brassicae TaxID=37360 RepID=A0A0G4J406_PLABS|nr:hypothetical protein PBRA_002492 [Plasmodiophora brassicae]
MRLNDARAKSGPQRRSRPGAAVASRHCTAEPRAFQSPRLAAATGRTSSSAGRATGGFWGQSRVRGHARWDGVSRSGARNRSRTMASGSDGGILSKVGHVLASPIRVLGRVSALLSPTRPRPAEAQPDDNAARKRRRSNEVTPNFRLRKTPRLSCARSMKRPRVINDENRDATNGKRRRTDAGAGPFVEKQPGRKGEELLQRMDERKRWCQEQLHRQLFTADEPVASDEEFVDAEMAFHDEPNDLAPDVFKRPVLIETPVRHTGRAEDTPSLRRSCRRSAKATRISMQFAPRKLSPRADIQGLVEKRKLEQARRVQENIKTRENELREQEREQRKTAEERAYWQGIHGPRIRRLMAGKTPLQILHEFCPGSRLGDDASVDALKRSFRKAMAKYHPDRSSRLPSVDKQAEAEEIFKMLQETRESLGS